MRWEINLRIILMPMCVISLHTAFQNKIHYLNLVLIKRNKSKIQMIKKNDTSNVYEQTTEK